MGFLEIELNELNFERLNCSKILTLNIERSLKILNVNFWTDLISWTETSLVWTLYFPAKSSRKRVPKNQTLKTARSPGFSGFFWNGLILSIIYIFCTGRTGKCHHAPSSLLQVLEGLDVSPEPPQAEAEEEVREEEQKDDEREPAWSNSKLKIWIFGT